MNMVEKVARAKEVARRKLNHAVRSGEVLRPNACEKCGVSGSTKDGRSYIHGHHFAGYEHPLKVQWLCPKCHFVFDPRPAGEKNGRAKISEDSVRQIRARYTKGKSRYDGRNSGKALAREFGIDARTVKRIVSREIWIDAALAEGGGK